MKRLEAVLTTLVAVAAVIVAAAVAKREISSSGSRPGAGLALANRTIAADDWEHLMAIGHPVGAPSGRVKVVALADFECPACKRFHVGLMRALSTDSVNLDVRYVHLPLSYHRFARPSARLFECAAEEGEVSRRLASLFFEHQDSLGLLSWREFASRAGASDAEALEDCVASSDSARFWRITRGIELAERIGAPGTPAVIIDGVLQAIPPTGSALLELGAKGAASR